MNKGNCKHPYRPEIQPLPEGLSRPLWSIMIPTYNCANYLRETLASVLTQDLGSELMQIEVVDDCSTLDDPKAVVEDLGRGRVSYYQQPQNVGYIKNFETCLNRSKGKLVHLLHGDDCVREGFYQKIQWAFEQYPEIGAAFCRHIYMTKDGHWRTISGLEQDKSGILENWLEKIAAGQRLATPSMVVRRDVYEKLGGFDNRISCYGEDWEMWVRIATTYPVWYEVKPLAIYRESSTGSLTEISVKKGKDTRDLRIATKIIESYLPKYLPSNKSRLLTNQAREKYGIWAIRIAHDMIDGGNISIALHQIREAFLCSKSIALIIKIPGLLIHMAKFVAIRPMKSIFHSEKV